MNERPAATALIALGSNIEPRVNLGRAFERLDREFGVRAVSGVWESEPCGAPGTPRFLNAAVKVYTRLAPVAVKALLRGIEADLGRRRSSNRSAPRTIDLDLALYDDQVIDDPETGLRIPDAGARRRAYMALPLAEVAPEVVHPVSGETLAEIAARLADEPEPPLRVAETLGSAPVGDS